MGVKPEEAQIEAARAVIANGLSVRRTEQLAAKLMREPKPEKPEDELRVDYAAEVTKRLEKAAGPQGEAHGERQARQNYA